MKDPCPKCGGSGTSSVAKAVPCLICNGTGKKLPIEEIDFADLGPTNQALVRAQIAEKKLAELAEGVTVTPCCWVCGSYCFDGGPIYCVLGSFLGSS